MYMRVKEVASRLGVAIGTVYGWVKRGELIPALKIGGIMLFTEEQVMPTKQKLKRKARRDKCS